MMNNNLEEGCCGIFYENIFTKYKTRDNIKKKR